LNLSFIEGNNIISKIMTSNFLLESMPKDQLLRRLQSSWTDETVFCFIKSHCISPHTTTDVLNKIATSFGINYAAYGKTKANKGGLAGKLLILLNSSETMHVLLYDYVLQLKSLKTFDFILFSVLFALNQKPMAPVVDLFVKRINEGNFELDAQLYQSVFANIDIL
jgi:hypothetical protein